MGRSHYTCPSVLTTEAKRPKYYIRAQVPMMAGPNILKSFEKTIYLGFCDEVGGIRKAERLRDEKLREINNTPTLLQSQVRFADLLSVYRSTYLPGLKPNSRESYQNDIKAHIEPAFGKSRLFEVDSLRVQQWVYQMENEGLSRASRRKYLGILSSIFEAAGMWGYTQSRNPCKGIKIGGAGEIRDLRPLEPWEAKRLIEVCAGERGGSRDGDRGRSSTTIIDDPARETSRDRSRAGGSNPLSQQTNLCLIVETALYTGLRIGEVLGLTWSAIDARARVLSVKQGKSQRGVLAEPKSAAGKRTVPIGFLADRFERPAGAKDSELIWPDAVYTNLQHAFRKIAASIGIQWPGFGFHTLRRSYATYRVMLGYAPPTAEHQEAMGHSSAQMTARYIKIRETDLVDRLRRLVESAQGPGQGKVLEMRA